jgi:ribosomal protein S18 acetylase RimI-like enzyme
MSPSLHIRPATGADRTDLRRAIVELQEHERGLHASRLPGELIADAYLAWVETQTAKGGATLVAETASAFAGFVAGWIEDAAAVAETPDSNRFAFISDLFVAPEFRGAGIAGRLIDAMEGRLAQPGISRLRIGVLAANEAAVRAYRRAGFLPYEVIYERPIAHPGRASKPT